jgi:2-desacetyl-2-hydroxyethyl bacteriochlorophyllide A dehydrogenase
MFDQPTMLAVTAASGGPGNLVTRVSPEPVTVPKPSRTREDEVLIRILRVGICATDRELLRGYSGWQGIIGHEFAGEVVYSDLYSWIRRRVTAHINIPPGRKGHFPYTEAKHDPDRRAIGIRGMDGAMAEYIVLPESVLVALPDNVSDPSAAMAEPLAAAMDGVSRLPGIDEPVLLIGDGRLAQLTARVLRRDSRAVHAIGRSDRKLGVLRDAGVEIVINEPEREYAAIVETSGSPAGLLTALNAAKPEATVVMKSTYSEMVDIDPSRIAVDELRLLGSRCGDVEAAVKLLADGTIEVEDLIDEVYPLRDAKRAFEHAFQPDTLKIQLDPRA